MNIRLLLAISSVAALASCSTSYKAQTPDDVYFSPAKPAAEYVKQETKQQEAKQQDQYKYDDYYSSEDRYLRWKVRDPQRWSTFDDYDYQWYAYNTPSYNYYSYTQPWGTYWNSYWTWNSSYNPYCHKVIVVNPKTNATVYNRIRTYTPGTYNNPTYNRTNGSRSVKVSQGAYTPTRTYNNSNSLGSAVKKMFSNSGSSNSSSGSSTDRSSRTYTPSSSSSSSSGSSSGGSRSSGGGGGSVGRPSRGG